MLLHVSNAYTEVVDCVIVVVIVLSFVTVVLPPSCERHVPCGDSVEALQTQSEVKKEGRMLCFFSMFHYLVGLSNPCSATEDDVVLGISAER